MIMREAHCCVLCGRRQAAGQVFVACRSQPSHEPKRHSRHLSGDSTFAGTQDTYGPHLLIKTLWLYYSPRGMRSDSEI